MIMDVVLVNSCFYIAFMFKFNFNPPIENIEPFLELIPFISFSSIVLFYVYGLYALSRRSFSDAVLSIIITSAIIILLTMASTFFIRGFAFPRSIFFYTFVLHVIILSTWRYLVYVLYRKYHGAKKAMIIGSNNEAEELAKKIMVNTRGWYDVRYIYNPNIDEEIDGLFNEVDTVFICSDIGEKKKDAYLREALRRRIETYLVPNIFDIVTFKSSLKKFDDVPTLSVLPLNLTIEQTFIKRAMDIVVSIIGIVLASPIMAVIAIAIKLTSPGPVIYKQVRVTKDMKKYDIYKFRTMVKDAEKITGAVLATDNDPRITKVGKYLRSLRLDELPQLFNVLKGDMSIIGPRPERPEFIEKFEEEIPGYKYRFNVKAGITGLAQVLGKYTTSPEDKLRYDLLYIRNYSIWLDIQILLQTIKVVFIKESSQGLNDDKTIYELSSIMNYKVFEEMGITKIEKID